ncbi:hypothetical protein SK128_009398 [Halocaridina rubra]|uniref:C2H2-type domain-containing protein n=1 Tax=Halocaridina rubra TaxID=373956 RepID=A0AAN8XL27_HALRR
MAATVKMGNVIAGCGDVGLDTNGQSEAWRGGGGGSMPTGGPPLKPVVSSGIGGLKTYECPYCPYRTIYSTHCQNHVRTHTGEQPFVCPHCARRFAQKGSLRRHSVL